MADERLAALEASLEAVRAKVDELLRLHQRSADHVDALHTENQQLRRGEVATANAPLLRDLMRTHDDVVRLGGASVPEASTDLALVRDLLLAVLDRWGISTFAPAEGDIFDPTEHHGVARTESAEHEDGTVALVRRCGFRHDDTIVRPAEVEVFRAVPVVASATESEEESPSGT